MRAWLFAGIVSPGSLVLAPRGIRVEGKTIAVDDLLPGVPAPTSLGGCAALNLATSSLYSASTPTVPQAAARRRAGATRSRCRRANG